jgi:excisionase family DNA binding protein
MSDKVNQKASSLNRGFRVDEAADYLRVSRATIYRLAHRKEIEIKKIAGRSVILRDELDRLLDVAPSAFEA